MATYTLLACDLMTNAVLAELPLRTFDYEARLNDPGAFNGAMALGDARISAIDPMGSTQPGRTALYIDRDGVLVWGGIIWKRKWQSSSQMLTFQGAEFLSYFAHRYIVDDQDFSAGVDQLTAAQQLVTYAATKSGGNIGITVPATTSGVFTTAVYKGYEYRSILKELKTLSSPATGFDIAIDVAYDVNGIPTKTFNTLYPRRGVTAPTSGLMWEHPGNIYDYDWPEDADRMADTVYGIGAGQPPTLLASAASAPGLITAGYPLLEAIVTDKQIGVQGILDAFTAGAQVAYQNPVVLPALTVSPSLDPGIGSYRTGDEARFRVTDPRFPNTLDTSYRIVGYRVSVDDRGLEKVALTLGPTV